ncbi:MAG: transcription elongation factor GreA [Oscillospiraceae bacterium]|nr:transcription elongation factor GreA [Oscillospiraceae bacterium]
MAKQIIVSRDGFLKLQADLEHLKTVKRKEVAQAIQKARAYGDLSENSEYDEAKNEQAEIESKIAALEETLENAVVMDDTELGTDKVSVGNTVNIHCIDDDREYTYKIVSAAEADPLEGRISDDCPLGKALLGQKQGASISVEAPNGVHKYTINNISK